jgi:hypothetical protein
MGATNFRAWAPLVIELYEILIASYILIPSEVYILSAIRTQFYKNIPFDDNRIIITFITVRRGPYRIGLLGKLPAAQHS